MAALTTFSTMAYIIFVNPMILQAAGMDFGAVLVATVLCTFLATLTMGLLANYPFALAPGMGLNAFFVYGLVVNGEKSWQEALGICFITALLFILLNLTGIRQKIMEALPSNLRLATTGGIGFFLAFIGFQQIRFIVSHPDTILTLGELSQPSILLAALGLLVMSILLVYQVKGAFFIGLLVNWSLGLALHLVEWKGVVDTPPSLSTFLQLEIPNLLDLKVLSLILSLTLIILFNTTGTLWGVSMQGPFLDKHGKLPRLNRTLYGDTIGTLSAALLGTSICTIFLESTSGIIAGGRTGLTAVFVAFLFLGALFFAPLIESIPVFATAPILILMGILMLKPLQELEWNDLTEVIPALLILLAIPLTFSISSGVAIGFIFYPLIKALTGRYREVNAISWVLMALLVLQFIV